ncbi:tyrosine-protein phosphatase [Novosphingobium sp. KCTC 2891]|uniref:tyrosine-protein phosphatase n=1 Tax=Novosphingobium sp. KCTC 2891 TaxID=2989730 RepID=UPI0022228508|nr:tyrosine-protein phosphatase [Novosphingobium sp. KCTC 2891]MCW1384393.1 tyrosine-protein phosphatase [Novosphingobium sp. KCTC 2891]
MQDRVLNLQGIHNFRDYGGYAARAGQLRKGALWRSGQHVGATQQDLDVVHGLGIGTVIDLRGDSERVAYPCLRHPEFDGEVMFEPGETASAKGVAVHEEMARQVVTEQDAVNAMVTLYGKLPFRPVLAGTYRLYFDALAGRDHPTLLHCLAGKDRTGVAAALVHTLLGVHHDDVLADYVLTNTAGNAEARIAAGATAVRSGFGARMEDNAVRVLMGVRPEFLETAFAAIRDQYGSVENYAEQLLGVDAAKISAMEEKLVA